MSKKQWRIIERMHERFTETVSAALDPDEDNEDDEKEHEDEDEADAEQCSNRCGWWRAA